MPPVRWKLIWVLYLPQLILQLNGQVVQEEITEDGWKPILGTRKAYYDSFPPNNVGVYSTVGLPATDLPPPVTTGSSAAPIYHASLKPPFNTERKIPHQKHPAHPYYVLPNNEKHGPHIPVGAVLQSRPSQNGHIKPKTPFTDPGLWNSKPARVQSNNRDEFLKTASSGIHNHYKPAPLNKVRTRETLGLGLPDTNHYSFSQPHAHVEFTNRFTLPQNENVYQQNNKASIPTYIFNKHPQNNEISYQVQNEDYNRNVIQPVRVYKTKTYTNRPKHENVVLQAPASPYAYVISKTEAPVQVQVTKEKLHEFHNNIPSNYHSQYIEYDFVRKPTDLPHVYEVTENQAWQEPPQRPLRTRKPSVSIQRPDETLPVFLPTPYKPDTKIVEPTHPTDSEASTVFTKLLNLKREKDLTTPSSFQFNVKEVSTHYPIFGKPVFIEQYIPKDTEDEVTTVEMETTTKEVPRRPLRRRRPTTTTTESSPEFEETERPVRIRRPIRYRTTTPSSVEETSTIMPNRGKSRYGQRNTNRPKLTRFEPEEIAEMSQENEELVSFEENVSEQQEYNEVTTTPSITTTEKLPATNLILPESDEIEESSVSEEPVTTVPPPVTTTEFRRIKGRPYKFDNSHRPRFSVKDYRQKLSSTTTTIPPPEKSTELTRIRGRTRRPLHQVNDEAKEDRYTTESSSIIVEKNVKSVNTRLRPFGRYRSTTAAPGTTPKISIKPNLFSRKRPTMISLRSKIFNKYSKNSTDPVEKVQSEEDEEEVQESTTIGVEETVTPEVASERSSSEGIINVEITTVGDIAKVDPYLYSQRVSDLTSSSKNNYDTPGVFKSVSPVSRRIPNHFTISTEDPILPIEAFFSNIKEKVNDEE